jgi:hypothetical protein
VSGLGTYVALVHMCARKKRNMRFSIIGDDDGKTLATCVVDESAGKAVTSRSENNNEARILDDSEDAEISETAEFLFIGRPPGSPQWHVPPWAGLIVLAAIVLAAWLLQSKLNNETRELSLFSALSAPQQAVPASVQASARTFATPVDPLVARAQFCQNKPVRCVSPTLTADPHRLPQVLRKQ